MVQINKEEELFKWEASTYPQIEAILASMEPYQRLFTSVYKWQKAEKKFMDGSFLELNAEETQAEVCSLYGICGDAPLIRALSTTPAM